MQGMLAAHNLPPEIETIAIAGSLGRMEATPFSDCDLIVVIREEIPLDGALAAELHAAVWRALAPLGLEAPRRDGIYASPTSRRELLDPATLGKVDEGLRAFGCRFQFLLEAQPVFAPAAYQALAADIVDRYASRYVACDPQKEWSYLLNDLIRYFRSLCVTYQWGSLDNPPAWRLRNIKARHSRLLMYAGLLLLLGESSRETRDKPAWLKQRLPLTPLERIAHVTSLHGEPAAFHRMAGCYDRFLAALAGPDLRRELQLTETPGDPLAREQNPAYAALKQNADEFLSELLRFVWARRGTWSERFFEYLIF